MLRAHWLRHLLLAAVLLNGQLFAVAHLTQHQLHEQPNHPPCLVCAFAHAGGALPSLPAVPEVAAFIRTPTLAAVDRALPRRPFNRPNSRAPPATLA